MLSAPVPRGARNKNKKKKQGRRRGKKIIDCSFHEGKEEDAALAQGDDRRSA